MKIDNFYELLSDYLVTEVEVRRLRDELEQVKERIERLREMINSLFKDKK